jgi:homoserine kinase type II
MAVYTHLSDEELRLLLADYDLGAALAFKGVAEGVENSNFLLDTEAGRFFLTIFEKRVDPKDLPFFMALMELLAEADFPAPRPMHTRRGAVLTEARGKPAVIVTFLPGVSPKRPSALQCRLIGEALARMHRALEGFGGQRANALSVGSWGGLVRPRLVLAEELRAGLADSAAADLVELEAEWPSGLPEGAIHADLFPDNSLFVGDRIGGVIDFYFACVDALAYDVAVCLNSWCFEPRGAFNLTKGQALLTGYQSVRPFSAAEREALPILSRGAAMRFFGTRLTDWAATPTGALVRPKDPLDYADRLDFHRRARKFSDYGG